MWNSFSANLGLGCIVHILAIAPTAEHLAVIREIAIWNRVVIGLKVDFKSMAMAMSITEERARDVHLFQLS